MRGLSEDYYSATAAATVAVAVSLVVLALLLVVVGLAPGQAQSGLQQASEMLK